MCLTTGANDCQDCMLTVECSDKEDEEKSVVVVVVVEEER